MADLICPYRFTKTDFTKTDVLNGVLPGHSRLRQRGRCGQILVRRAKR